MKLLEKVKNMFTEEVEEDVKVEQVKVEPKRNVFETTSTNNEELQNTFEFKVEEKTSSPIFFDDNDFNDLKIAKKEEKIEIKEKPQERTIDKPQEKELYRTKKIEKSSEKKSFKPTPIISPVYGVLDKNYYKEDIVSKNDIKRPKDEVIDSSIDSVRAKAYGTLEDELENTLFGSNSILFKKDDDTNNVLEDDLEIQEISNEELTNLADDISKELDELIVKKEKYVESDLDDKNIDANNEKIDDDDLLSFIDSTLYKDGDDNNDY